MTFWACGANSSTLEWKRTWAHVSPAWFKARHDQAEVDRVAAEMEVLALRISHETGGGAPPLTLIPPATYGVTSEPTTLALPEIFFSW
jgi:hypothetical protein